jgi:hypothetical protein
MRDKLEGDDAAVAEIAAARQHGGWTPRAARRRIIDAQPTGKGHRRRQKPPNRRLGHAFFFQEPEQVGADVNAFLA